MGDVQLPSHIRLGVVASVASAAMLSVHSAVVVVSASLLSMVLPLFSWDVTLVITDITAK